MNLESIKTFLSDRRAVSPVLGVALLIAITVILAGVIGFVVLGVQAGNADGPSASLVIEDDGTNYNMVHKGGDTLKTAELRVMANGTAQAQTWSGDKLNTGTSDALEGVASGDAVRIVWEDPNSDREVLIAEFNLE